MKDPIKELYPAQFTIGTPWGGAAIMFSREGDMAVWISSGGKFLFFESSLDYAVLSVETQSGFLFRHEIRG